MNKTFSALLFVLPLTAAAEMPAGMNMDPAQMQKMMEQAQKLQSCMQQIDRSALKALEQRGRAMETEIKQLCAAGKRGEALSTAMNFAMESMQDPAVQAMKSCGEQVMHFLPNLPTDPADLEKEQENKHICDSM